MALGPYERSLVYILPPREDLGLNSYKQNIISFTSSVSKDKGSLTWPYKISLMIVLSKI